MKRKGLENFFGQPLIGSAKGLLLAAAVLLFFVYCDARSPQKNTPQKPIETRKELTPKEKEQALIESYFGKYELLERWTSGDIAGGSERVKRAKKGLKEIHKMSGVKRGEFWIDKESIRYVAIYESPKPEEDRVAGWSVDGKPLLVENKLVLPLSRYLGGSPIQRGPNGEKLEDRMEVAKREDGLYKISMLPENQRRALSRYWTAKKLE